MKFCLLGAALLLSTSALSAGIFTYDANLMPAAVGFPSQIIFGDTTMEVGGGVLRMTTYPFEGVWFGATGGMAPWFEGNYLGVDARVSPDATDWYIYFGDLHNIAILTMSAGSYTYQTSTGIFGGAMDLNSAFHGFDIWMKNGIVTYAIDNSVIYSGAAVGYGNNPLLIGDPSGTDAGTTGSMFVDQVRIVNGTDFDSAPGIPDSPEPSTLLLGLAGLGGIAWARRKSL